MPIENPSDALPLRTRVVRAAGWVSVGKATLRLLAALRLVVLARMLTPRDFGLFGLVFLTVLTVETFTETGFNVALIRRRESAEDLLDTAWTVQVVRGLGLAGVLLLLAEPVAAFFDEPRAALMLRVMCLSVAIEGFANIGVVHFRRELEFHKDVPYDLIRATVGVAVALGVALRFRSVWALVLGDVAGAVARTVSSYVLHPYRPHLRFNRDEARELFAFGRWMLASYVVIFLAARGPDALLGKLLGAAALGLYQVAFQVAGTAAVAISTVSSLVMLPVYAKVQTRQEQLARGFLRSFEAVNSLVVPLAVFIALAAPELVLGLLGENWGAAVLPVRILALAGALRTVSASGEPAFVAVGRPDMHFLMQLMRLGVTAAALYPLTVRFGIPGLSVAVTCGVAAALPLWARVVPLLGLKWGQVIRAAGPGVILGLSVPAGVLLGRLIPVRVPLLALTCEAMVTGALVCVGAGLAARMLGRGPFVQARQAWAAFRSRKDPPA